MYLPLLKSYPTGNISKHIGELKLGDKIRVRGPKGQFIHRPNVCKAFGMIAGGTGITPMLQIIKAVLKNPEDKTQLSLIFANVNEEDILLKKDLDLLAQTHPDQFKVEYVLNNVRSFVCCWASFTLLASRRLERRCWIRNQGYG
jgi:cytochrome-b5 reductase